MHLYIQSLLLGILQGLTEFLPVSSSGHLEIGKALFGFEQSKEDSLLFTVVVHAATALSTIVVFRKDIGQIFSGLFKGDADQWRFASRIVLSMVPAAFVGLVFLDELESLFDGAISFVATMLLLTGVLLLIADRTSKKHKKIGFLEAGMIGLAQAIAILPGISRSGATISTAVILGVDKEKAARFSFLMVIPLILGKMIVDTKSLMEMGSAGATESLVSLLIGFTAAFFTGIWACQAMISFVKKSKLSYFAYYCFAVGTLTLAFTFFV